MKPLDNELLNRAFFPPTLLSRKKNLENILNQNSLGMYVVGGDRGVGKTTLMNSIRKKFDGAINEYSGSEKKSVFLHLNVVNKKTDLLRELILFLEQTFNENFTISNFDNKGSIKLQEIENYRRKITLLKENILFDILLEEIEESNNSNDNTVKLGNGFKMKIALTNMISSNINLSSMKKYSTGQRVQNRKIKSSRQRKEDLIKEVVNLFDFFSKRLSLVVILDELDKMSGKEIKSFIEDNKSLLTECSAIFFLLFDNKRFLDIRYSKKHLILRNMVREYIFLSRLNWQEFILVVPKILKIDDLEHLQKIYYLTKGNFREIIKIRKDCDDLYRLSIKNGMIEELSLYSNETYYILVSLLNDYYLKSLPEDLKELAIDFIVDVLQVFRINNYITEQELNEIETQYLSENIVLNSVIRRVKSIMIKYSDHSDRKEKNTLKEELLKYYPQKEFFSATKRYQPIELETTEISVLFRIINIYYDSIDGVIICKQEIDNTQYNISYTASILISNNYMPSIVLVNENGFAWNYEYIDRYAEMLKYLNEQKIKYIDIHLPINETIKEQLDSNLSPLIDKFKEKYEC